MSKPSLPTKNKLFGTNTAVNPLLTTLWDQSPDIFTTGPYNALCPYDSIYKSHTLTGCVATAMAQVMKYWNYPTKGIGTHSYTPPTKYLGVQTVNFGNTSYQWNLMPDTLSANDAPATINAVATLMYHCGVSVDMDYGVNGSGALVINNTDNFWSKSYHNLSLIHI